MIERIDKSFDENGRHAFSVTPILPYENSFGFAANSFDFASLRSGWRLRSGWLTM